MIPVHWIEKFGTIFGIMNLGACYAVSKLAIESGVNGTGQTNNVYLFIYSIIYSLIYLSDRKSVV